MHPQLYTIHSVGIGYRRYGRTQYKYMDTSKLTVEDTHMRHPIGSSLIGVPGHLSDLIGESLTQFNLGNRQGHPSTRHRKP